MSDQITRLRPAHTEDRLRQIYAQPHNHRRHHDHLLRVSATVEVARWLMLGRGSYSIADLSCGDATIAQNLQAGMNVYLGDYAPGYQYQGPLEQTIRQIPRVGLYICSETVEHLDDPAAALRQIRSKTDRLVLSTPVDAWGDGNVEHYWAWSRAGVETLLDQAQFRPQVYTAVDFRMLGPAYYQFGIWGCR